MRFEQITIENLFCYYGSVPFAGLDPKDSGRPLVIIRGRNNRGRTSFLRSLKLLFTGITQDLRDEVSVYRRLSPGQYFRGDGIWQGMRNRHAVEEKRQRFAVSAIVRDGIDEIEIERSWDNLGDEQVRVTGPHGTFRDEAAREWLEQRVPPEIVPYYFFDGELVQRLVNEHRVEAPAAIRSLFGLQPMIDLRDEVHEVVKAWARAEAPDETRKALDQLSLDIQSKELEISRLDAQLASMVKEIESVAAELGAVDERLNRLAARGTEAEFARIEEAEKAARETLGALDQRILKEEIPWLPLWVNADLVARVQGRLTAMLQRPTEVVDASIRIWSEVGEDLPSYIFKDAPTSFTAEQRAYVGDRVAGFVRTRTPERRLDQAWSLSAPTARQIHHDLDRAGERVLGDLLRERAGMQTRLEQLRSQRRDFSHLTEDETRERAHLNSERDRLLVERTRAARGEQELRGRLQGAHQRLTQLNRERREVEEQLERNLKAYRKFAASRGLRELLPKLVGRLAHARVQSISLEMQSRFELLYSSNTQIGRCFLRDDFTIGCEDRSGREIARGGLSSGIQQLLAMAMLWTLVDESKRELPVVFNNPLARLDTQHRDAVVVHLFPNLAEQVLLLPTDSELPASVAMNLAPHTHLMGELQNPTGGRATFVRAA